MKPNDIEELLQIYGADQRQQQQAADHVRHLAHRQAQRRTWAACVAVLVAIVGVVMHRWQQLPEPTGILVAEQATPITPHTPTMPPSIEPTATPTAHVTTRAKSTPRALVAQPQVTPTPDLPARQAGLPDDFGLSDHTDNSNPPSTAPDSPSAPTHPLISITSTSPTPPQQKTAKASRLHFTASIGASTAANASLGRYDDNLTDMNGISPTTNHSTITPAQNLSANVGVAYTVASYHRSHLDVGFALSGYTGQCDIHIHEFSYTYAYSIEENSRWTQHGSGGLTPIPNSTTEHYTYNTFSLFASLPLTLNLHPRGIDRLGWQLSLTPARALVSTPSLGNHATNHLNPWKLTLGIGIAIPNSTIRHISLTANMLPLYTSHPLHEFGIEIGI